MIVERVEINGEALETEKPFYTCFIADLNEEGFDGSSLVGLISQVSNGHERLNLSEARAAAGYVVREEKMYIFPEDWTLEDFFAGFKIAEGKREKSILSFGILEEIVTVENTKFLAVNHYCIPSSVQDGDEDTFLRNRSGFEIGVLMPLLHPHFEMIV